MNNTRMTVRERKQIIIDAAMQLANKEGFDNLRRSNIASSAKVSEALVSKYWGTMPQLKRQVMRAAIAREELAIIAHGIVSKDKQAMKVSAELKKKALDSIL